MTGWIRELVTHRDVLFMVTWREIKIKYKQSVMGFLWAILMPTVIVAAGVLVRYGFSRVAGRALVWEDIAAVTLKSVPWAFFVASIRFGTMSLIGNSALVTKIYLPREIFPIAAVLSQLVDFAVASGVVLVIMVVAGAPLTVHVLWVPVLVLLLIVLVAGMAMFFAAASLFFRDVKYLVEVALTFAIFFTPVFYEVSLFERWANLLMLNPVAPILESLTATVVYGMAPPLDWLGYSAAFAVTGLLLAATAFRKLEPYFAESI